MRATRTQTARERKTDEEGRDGAAGTTEGGGEETENPAGSRPTTWAPRPRYTRVATCQITHLARVNNYSETRIIALYYACISHACVSARGAHCLTCNSRRSNVIPRRVPRPCKGKSRSMQTRNSVWKDRARMTDLALKNERNIYKEREKKRKIEL